jgi:hypothetical protein
MQLEADVLGDYLFENHEASKMIRLTDQAAGVASEVLADDEGVPGDWLETLFHVKRSLEALFVDGTAAGVFTVLRVDVAPYPVLVLATCEPLIIGAALSAADRVVSSELETGGSLQQPLKILRFPAQS